MENRTDLTVPLPGWMVEVIENQLEYGDSKAGFVRESTRQRFEREGLPATKAEFEESKKTDADTEGNGTSGRAAGAN